MSMPRPDVKPAPAVRPLINIGALMDIPTGTYIKGKHGENLLLGGLGSLTGIVGIGNSFKSTLMHYMMLSAADKIFSSHETILMTYDTEMSIHEGRMNNFTKKFDNLAETDIINEQLWLLSDKNMYHGEQWFDKVKDYLKDKLKAAKDITFETPFLDRDRESLVSILLPSFSEIDSLSDFETSEALKMQDEHLIGESGGNMLHARLGLAKTRLLMEIPHLASAYCNYFLMTAHLGKEMNMSTGPHQQLPTKKLQHMRMGDKIRGVSDRFFFTMSNCWLVMDAKPYINQTTKSPEYPRDTSETNDIGNNDLNIMTVKQLRSKSGPTGTTIELLVSQSEGILPALSEFHYIKSKERFGLEGSLQNYSLDLCPDIKLSRTTVRSKIDSEPMLRRALNITAELCQLHQYQRTSLAHLLCTPKELYEGIKNAGYEWGQILTETRGWWTIDNDNAKLKYLSTMDLLEMRLGLYKPYWKD